MPAAASPLLGLLILLQANLGRLPPQPDLDLPVVLQHYDPNAPAPGPVPPEAEGDDPRDEPPPVFFGEEIPTEQGAIIFVLDFSSSMIYGDRVGVVRKEFARCVSALPPSFRFNVVAYRCDIQLWAPNARQATAEAKDDAIAWVDNFRAADATATGPAVAAALQSDRTITTLILLTDGEPTCGTYNAGLEAHREVIRRNNVQGAQINVFGIAATGIFRGFCQDVAADSGGSYRDVPLN